MVAFIQQVSVTMPTPTLVNGRPQQPWVPTVTRSDWGKLQLIVNGYGMTRARGKRFLPLSWSYTEPFGDADASFAFPGLTEHDDPADWHLNRLAPVRLRRKDPSGNFHVVWEGDLASIEPDDQQGLVIHCVGVLYRMDLLKRPPTLLTGKHDYGYIVPRAFNHKRRNFALNVAPMQHVHTGIVGTPPSDFSPFLTGFVQDCLAQMTTDDGDQWTIGLKHPRTPVFKLKDMTTVDATVSYGAPGVTVSLSKDFTSAITAVYGSGTNGHCSWMGAQFPNLTQQSPPAFPLTVGATFVAGDGQGGFAPFAAFLRRGQYGTIVSDDTYDPDDVDNVVQFQDRAGISADGIVGAQTWTAAFQAGADQGSIAGAKVEPIWEKKETRKRLYNAQGAEVGPNPDFDPRVPRIEDYVPFGDNVSKNLARTSAKQLVNRAHPAGQLGTITLTTDPAEMSRFDLRDGMNVLVQNFEGTGNDVLLHGARVDVDGMAQSVTVVLDEKARDLLTAAAIHQRRKDVADLTRRQHFGRTRSHQFNDYGTMLCEDGAGEIPLMNQQGGLWNVQRIAASQKGSIARITLALGSGLTEHLLNQALGDGPNNATPIPGPTRGAVAIFAKPVTANSLANLLGNPLHVDTIGNNPWDREAPTLLRKGMIFAAGGPSNGIGFYPNNDPGDGSGTGLTGLYDDGGGFDYGPTGRWWLWVAIYTEDSCKVGGRIFPGPPN